MKTLITGGPIILPDRILEGGAVLVEDAKILSVHSTQRIGDLATLSMLDLRGNYLAPGFIDLHVHGGDGADFMDGTRKAFRTICRAHARHGTTSLLATSTVARHDQHLTFLET